MGKTIEQEFEEFKAETIRGPLSAVQERVMRLCFIAGMAAGWSRRHDRRFGVEVMDETRRLVSSSPVTMFPVKPV